LDGLGLDVLGIDPKDFGVDDRCQVEGTSRVWAAGDVTMIAPFTHVANYQARVVAANVLDNDMRADYTGVPRAIYVDPTVAAVGLTAGQAKEEGRDVRTVRFDLSDTALHAVEQTPAGPLVMTAEADTLIGASAVGPHAMEWLGEVGLAIRAGLPLSFLANNIHAFPTYAEALGECYRELARG
jgi:dihydrolipoamide dehydrogenase